MDKENQNYVLTEEEQKLIAEKLHMNDNDANLKVLNQSSDNIVEFHPAEGSGEKKYVQVKIDPETGENTIIGNIDTVPETKEFNEIVDDLASSEIIPDNHEITINDFKTVTEEETMIGKVSISDETALQLVNLMNELKKNHKKANYTMLPEEVKEIVNDYCARNGAGSFSVQNNTIRNTISEMLIDEFMTNISMNAYMDDFNKELENIYKSSGEEISPLIKEYNESRIDIINEACDKIEDPEKKAIVEATIENVNEAYSLIKFREGVKRIKIKKFHLEKPKKIFDQFLFKYTNSKYNIFDISTVLPILHRHLIYNKVIQETDLDSAIKIMIAFCLYCKNYKPENPVEHAFMHYFTYNITLLDIYKGDQYTEFAAPFMDSLEEVLNNLK